MITGTTKRASWMAFVALALGCGGRAEIHSVCKADSSCGASCTACGTGTPKCKDLGTTSQCVGCLSDGDCSAATPSCNTSNVCGPPPPPPPSCVGLAATC